MPGSIMAIMAINQDQNIVRFHDHKFNTGNQVTKNPTTVHTKSNNKYRVLYFLIDFLSIIAEATINPKKKARINTG
jgi:hypothetical protein